MLAAIKGLSRHKRLPPTRGGRVLRLTTKAASAPRAVPPIYSTFPLTAAARGGVRKASGRKGVNVARSAFAAPAGGVEQKG
jgi:hypothetical protein